MVQKNLPVYYVAILWIVSLVSVFYILKPLMFSTNGKNHFENASRFKNTAGNNENSGLVEDSSLVPVNTKKETDNMNNGNDLVFYDKTAFIRYFSDKYSEEELMESYDKAVAEKAVGLGKTSILVVRKGINNNTKKSFSGSFDIRPVPFNKNN